MPEHLHKYWSKFKARYFEHEPEAVKNTGVPVDQLKELGQHLSTEPQGIALDNSIKRFLQERANSFKDGKPRLYLNCLCVCC